MSKVFISYRRQDSGTAARRIAAEFGARYGEGSVFIDTDSIRIGSHWAEDISNALRDASVIVAVIGPKWIYTHDEHGRRRIDNEDDWVRKEVLHGLMAGKYVVPLLVQGAPQLESVALPEPLRDLCGIQNYEISDKYWERDIQFLFSDLDGTGRLPVVVDSKLVYPARIDKSVALSNTEALAAIDPSAGWSLVTSKRSIGGQMKHASELTKTYQFQTFEDCIHFMSTAARHISYIDHHPRWENIWVNLIVSLTSWDIEGKITYKDIRLAKYLDELFITYRKPSEA